MTIDDEVCFRAHQSRDARFDGRFFVGVTSTRIYCRPICPARTPQRKNIAFYVSAAAAEEAGFRPCRRCRPDAAPGSPEWRGQSALTARALRMIHDGAMNEGGVDVVAERVGVSARHLGRLFHDELGCSPVAVAQTVRAHLARKLIDETAWTMTEIAFGAGYQSVRRFNTAMKTCFGRSPSELRAAGPQRTRAAAPRPLALRLAYRPPFDWEHMLGFLAARAIPGVEVVDGGAYRRAVLQEGRTGWIEVRHAPARDSLELATNLPASRGFGGLVERVRRLFDLRADPRAIQVDLARDPRIRARVARRPGLRVPGAWDGFELAVRAVLGQQVTVKGAGTLLGRLVARHGHAFESGEEGLDTVFPTPEAIVAADLATFGVPRARAAALQAVASAVIAGDVDLEPSADPDETRRALCALPGIGSWTAEYVAMRALRDPDAFPAGDLVLRRALPVRGEPLTERALAAHSERWRPWRAYAAVLLWSTAKPKPKVKPKVKAG